jgi:hypothetical protein
MYKFFYGYIFPFLLGKYLGAGCLDSTVIVYNFTTRSVPAPPRPPELTRIDLLCSIVLI